MGAHNVGGLPHERQFVVEGMTCAACARRVERALQRVPGVLDASVDPVCGRARVRADESVLDVDLGAAITRSGYSMRPIAPGPPAIDPVRAVGPRRALDAVLLAGALVAFAMVPSLRALGGPWLEALLAICIMLGPGLPVLRGAARAVRAGTANADVLVTLGALAALGLSAPALVDARDDSRPRWFETAGVLVALLVVGRALEGRARDRATAALYELLYARPPRATVLRDAGPVEVYAHQVRVGERVHVRAHERVPVDGRVVEGRGEVDLSAVNGESAPVPRGPGDEVPAGAINGGSPLILEAVRVGTQTTIAQIASLVAAAQLDRPAIQRLADRVSARFVPAVVLVALATFALWAGPLGADLGRAAMIATSVLVVACPCALGLATPLALHVANGALLRRGVIVREAAAIERAATVRTVLFDKTGTLSRGRPELVDVVVLDDASPREVVRAAAALEVASPHPLAGALLRAAGGPPPGAERVESVPGAGVRGCVDGRWIAVGSEALLEAPLDDAPARALASIRAEGRTAALVLRDGRPWAVLGFADVPREQAAEAIAKLRAMGIAVGMVSGDHEAPARALGRAVGLLPEEIVASCSPTDKVRVVRGRAAAGPVAFVGDGINDAPALAAASVGIAMATGVAPAVRAAPMSLLRTDLRVIAEVLTLCRRAMRTVRINLFWAFAYNVAMVPLAATGLLEELGGPMLAAAAMTLSSVSVAMASFFAAPRHRPLRGPSDPAHSGASPTPENIGEGG
ncbi:MAG: cation-translocating P-type ATPase [Myxococcales bacterium]|nr:cation-translocating P-type ATPase [Myxococcales bacterium]